MPSDPTPILPKHLARVFREVKNQKRATLRELALALDTSEQIASKNLAQLRAFGMLTRETTYHAVELP